MKRKSRFFVIATVVIAVLVVSVAYQYGYLYLRSEMISLKETEASKTRTLEKYMKLIAERPDMEKKLEALRVGRKAETSKVIDAQTLSLAAAALQETVKGVITGRGGSIASERVEKPDSSGKFRIVTVSIDAVLPDARALSDVLYGIETRTPYLVVKEADIRVRNFKDPRELMFKIRVSALTGGK